MSAALGGRTIVVVGGVTGIGRAAVSLLSRSGAQVALVDSSESVVEVAEALGAQGFSANVGRASEVESAFRSIGERFGKIHGVFANAGINPGGAGIHQETTEAWDEVMSVNLRGMFLVVREGVRSFMERGVRGSIVCTSSILARLAVPNEGTAYTASKGGIESLVRQVAVDYARYGIRINAVAPGPIDTPMMWKTVSDEEVQAVLETLEREVPLGRIGTSEDVARCVVWLLSDDAGFVTGATFTVDGGVASKQVLPL